MEEGHFCRKHGARVLPALLPFLKPPINRPKPKEKIRFNFTDGGENAGGANSGEESEEKTMDDRWRPSFNHLEPAFRRPREENRYHDHDDDDDWFGGIGLGLILAGAI